MDRHETAENACWKENCQLERGDHIQEETVTAGSPVMVSNQREEDLGVSSQNTIEAESSDAINQTGSIPTASTNRTDTTNELIDKLSTWVRLFP
jgi:hypothetical protein